MTLTRAPAYRMTERQRRIAGRAGPWTRPDYLTSARAQAIDAAWVQASGWDFECWKRRNGYAKAGRSRMTRAEA